MAAKDMSVTQGTELRHWRQTQAPFLVSSGTLHIDSVGLSFCLCNKDCCVGLMGEFGPVLDT